MKNLLSGEKDIGTCAKIIIKSFMSPEISSQFTVQKVKQCSNKMKMIEKMSKFIKAILSIKNKKFYSFHFK